MAFQSEDLSCSICQEIFRDPVILSCSHSFCKDCLRSWWREKPTQECPVCKRRSSRSDPPRNLTLRNRCEPLLQQREQKTSDEQLCPERLKMLCLTDQQPVGVVCRDSKVHEDHRFRPTEEAVHALRDELDKSLLPLRENLQKAVDLKNVFGKLADHIKKQFQHTERQIQAEFEKLHQFLVEEEESRIKALREEEEQKAQGMKDKMAAVSREIEALSESIRATEEQLRVPDVSFLHKYKAAVERVQHCPLLDKHLLRPEALIDQAKHLGNLAFNIWTNMKRLVHFTPVILDPNKVQNVVLSDDLTSLTFDKEEADQKSPGFSEGGVVGSEGFSSGSHSWDVDVGDNEEWALGVGADPFEALGQGEDIELWVVGFLNGQYAAVRYVEEIPLKLVSKPRRIRVCLDCDKHELSFYDADANSHIHTFTNISQKKLFPFFINKSKCPIRILPQKI